MKKLSAILISMVLALLCTVSAFAEEYDVPDTTEKVDSTTKAEKILENDYYTFSVPEEWEEIESDQEDVYNFSSDYFSESYNWTIPEKNNWITLHRKHNSVDTESITIYADHKEELEEDWLKTCEKYAVDVDGIKPEIKSHDFKIKKIGNYDCTYLNATITYYDKNDDSTFDCVIERYAFMSKSNTFIFDFFATKDLAMSEAEQMDILKSFKPKESILEIKESSVTAATHSTINWIIRVVVIAIISTIVNTIRIKNKKSSKKRYETEYSMIPNNTAFGISGDGKPIDYTESESYKKFLDKTDSSDE